MLLNVCEEMKLKKCDLRGTSNRVYKLIILSAYDGEGNLTTIKDYQQRVLQIKVKT